MKESTEATQSEWVFYLQNSLMVNLLKNQVNVKINKGLTGKEKFNFHIGDRISIGQIIDVTTDTGKSFKVKARIDTEPEIEYYKDGGILIYVMKKLLK